MDSCDCNDKCPENSDCYDIIDKNSHECVCDDCFTGNKCQIEIVNCDCNNPCAADQPCRMENGEVRLLFSSLFT